jgi:hypothetical protein
VTAGVARREKNSRDFRKVAYSRSQPDQAGAMTSGTSTKLSNPPG